MKLFLLFLCTSFVLGITLDKASTQRRVGVAIGITLGVTVLYFFFNQFI